MQALYLSLPSLAKAVYERRVSAEDLRRAYFCFVYDEQSKLEAGVAGIVDLLRYECVIVEKRCEEAHDILSQELFRAERKGRVVWRESRRHDGWGDLNRMLVRQGFQSLKTSAPYSLRAVAEAVKAAHVPLRPVIIPD